MGVHFQVVVYKELVTFPSEWERLLQSVIQVFKLQVLSSKCVLQVVKGFNIEV
jgi:hypothetical protein